MTAVLLKRSPSGGAALILVVAVALAGCSESDGGTSTEGTSQDVRLSAEEIAQHSQVSIDRAADTIALPADGYMLTHEEIATLQSARALAMQKCAAKSGVQIPWSPTKPFSDGDRRYGVWLEERAAAYGYALPSMTEGEPYTGGTPEEQAELEANMGVFEDCNTDDPDVKSLNYESIKPGFDYATEFSGQREKVFASPEARAVFDEWEACLGENGLERDPEISPFAIKGASLEVTEQNIATALADVRCKDQVGFVERLSALEGQEQAPVVAKHERELVEMRGDYDAIVETARAYLAAHAG